ncbi:MAG: Pyruvoyl-dependent arginine decarboxylase [Planctomycetes bacterium]|nr:Pyruvoyl-dependent arginine decarboxylase [Planctomycetota bacterium]MCQ3950601.1 arginine decarboxylase, pyruvoyl-dependent [Planctomycetota bacterium]GIK53749.1 MAG: putative pyruvoyl-dependent arginine decarboxylase [Planctomycetota bacterium]
MYQLVPTRCFLTKGVGISKDYLASFEDALRDAGIAALNIVTISSIFPPHCKLISKEKGVKELHDGQIGFCVMSRQSTNEYRRMIAASVGVAVPKDPTRFGYLSELHDYGQNDEQLGEKAEDLAASMLATVLGAPFDSSKAWKEREQEWKIGGHMVATRNITQSAEGPKDGHWATVIAACVFIFDNWGLSPEDARLAAAKHHPGGLLLPAPITKLDRPRKKSENNE